MSALSHTEQFEVEPSGSQFVVDAVWQTYRDLGATAFETGRLDLSVKLFRAALKYVRQAPNSELLLGTIASDLAMVYCRQQRFREATCLMRQVISLYERLLGLNHPYLAALTCDLAFIYGRQGRGPYCARAYKDAQDMLNKSAPGGYRLLRQAMEQVGSFLWVEERFSQAERFFQNDRAGASNKEESGWRDEASCLYTVSSWRTRKV